MTEANFEWSGGRQLTIYSGDWNGDQIPLQLEVHVGASAEITLRDYRDTTTLLVHDGGTVFVTIPRHGGKLRVDPQSKGKIFVDTHPDESVRNKLVLGNHTKVTWSHSSGWPD